MTMWIILGSLVGVVMIFLVVASLLDRKKQKKQKAEIKIMEKAKEEAADRTVVFLMLALEKNKKELEDFVPSVGKIKMGDIRAKSKKAMNAFTKTNTYTFLKSSESNKKIFEIFKKFNSTNSNIWETKLAKEVTTLKKKYVKIDKEIKEIALEDFRIEIYKEDIKRKERETVEVKKETKPKKKGKK